MAYLSITRFSIVFWILILFSFQASANKLRELREIRDDLQIHISETLEADAFPEDHSGNLNHPARRAIASQTLARVANWISTLSTWPSKELNSERQALLYTIFRAIQDFTRGEIDSNWHSLFPDLIASVAPHMTNVMQNSVAEEIHKILHTGVTLTNSMMQIHETGIKRKILDLLPEEEVIPKGRINRSWRSIIHQYQKNKGYPSALFPQDREQLRRILDHSPLLSNSEINTALLEAEFFGFASHRRLADTILRVAETQNEYGYYNSKELSEDLLSLISTEYPTLLNELVFEILQVIDDNHLISHTRLVAFDKYHALAEAGNTYAEQTLNWLLELKCYSRYFPSRPSLSNRQIPSSFPDSRLYSFWKHAKKLTKEIHPNHTYSYRAALRRQFRQPYFQFNFFPCFFDDRRHYLTKHSAETFLNIRERSIYCSYLKRNAETSQQWSTHQTFLRQEAASFIALGDPQRAISLLAEEEKKQRTPEDRYSDLSRTLFLYDTILASKSNLTPKELIHGKNENVQKRILENDELAKEERTGLPREFFNAGLHLEALKAIRAQPRILASDYFLKWDLLMAFFRSGALQSLIEKQLNEESLSSFDPYLKPELSYSSSMNEKTSENQKEITFSPEEEAIRELLKELENVDPELWAVGQKQGDVAKLFSTLKQFKRVTFFYEQVYRLDDKYDSRHLAYAYLETGEYQKALHRIASCEDAPIDFEIQIRALQKLDRTKELEDVYRRREVFECTSQVPDLIQAAVLYLEDDDFMRARKVLIKANQLLERLNDPDLLTKVKALEAAVEQNEKKKRRST